MIMNNETNYEYQINSQEEGSAKHLGIIDWGHNQE